MLYGATAALLAAVVRPGGRRASPLIALFLSILPLAHTAAGFLPRQTLAPTPMLSGVAPWADPALVGAVSVEAGTPNPVLLDPVSQMIPWSRAARDDLLFNPAQGAGAALLGNGQSAVLFPTEAASRLLAPFRAVTYSQAARLLFAAWGAFLLLRVAGFTELAAAASAAVFVGSGFVQLWRLHPHSLVAATAPWILAAAVVHYRRPGPRSAVLVAAAGAVGVAGGHPETLLHVLLFAAPVVPALTWLGTDRQARWGSRAVWGAAAALLSVLLAAPVLLPVLETLRVSTEWTERRPQGRTNLEASLRDSLERMRPAGALHALGDPVAGTWRGPENLAELGGGATGGAALFLAALALMSIRGRGGRAALLTIAAAGLLGLAVGAHAPIVSRPFGWIPLLQDTLLQRLSLWWVLAVTILAAAGTDAITERGGVAGEEAARRDATALGRRRRHRAIGVTLAALIVLALVALAIGNAPREEAIRIWIGEGGAIVAALLTAALLAERPRSRRASHLAGDDDAHRARLAVGGLLLLATLVVSRAAIFAHWMPSTPPEGFYPGTPALRVVIDRLGTLPRSGFRVTGLEAALVPHSAAFFRLEEIRPYDPMTFAPYRAFLMAVAEAPTDAWVRVIDPRTPALAFLGVRLLLENPPPPLPASPRERRAAREGRRVRRDDFFRAGLRLAYEGSDAVVWESGHALPRAFFPRAWRIESVDGAIEAAARIDDFAALAVVDRAPIDVDATAAAAAANPPARVLALEVAPRSIDVDTAIEPSGAAILATSQPAIPGWRLTLDGVAAPHQLRRVNGAFLGVAVPPGRHRVILRYAPSSWRIGLVLFACGAVGATLLLLLDRRSRAERRRVG